MTQLEGTVQVQKDTTLSALLLFTLYVHKVDAVLLLYLGAAWDVPKFPASGKVCRTSCNHAIWLHHIITCPLIEVAAQATQLTPIGSWNHDTDIVLPVKCHGQPKIGFHNNIPPVTVD